MCIFSYKSVDILIDLDYVKITSAWRAQKMFLADYPLNNDKKNKQMMVFLKIESTIFIFNTV